MRKSVWKKRSSQIMWILDRINETPQATSLGIFISASPPDELARLIQCKDVSNIERLIFVANVSKNPDNSVFLSTHSDLVAIGFSSQLSLLTTQSFFTVTAIGGSWATRQTFCWCSLSTPSILAYPIFVRYSFLSCTRQPLLHTTTFAPHAVGTILSKLAAMCVDL